jgi:hypothetical protein
MKLAALIISLMVLVLIADVATDPVPGYIATGGTIGLLGGLLWYLLHKHIPLKDTRFIAAIKDVAERHDRWEQQRHEDTTELIKVLTTLRVTCTKNQAAAVEAARKLAAVQSREREQHEEKLEG